MNAAIEGRDVEPLAFREREGVVLVLGRVTATGAEWAAVAVVEAGEVTSLRHFDNHDEAIAAA